MAEINEGQADARYGTVPGGTPVKLLPLTEADGNSFLVEDRIHA